MAAPDNTRLARLLAAGLAMAIVSQGRVSAQDAPALFANVDQISGRAGEALIFNPLRNDDLLQGGSATIRDVSAPQHGTAVVQDSSTISYTPAQGYNGQDSFTYTISQGGAQATGQVMVNLIPVNAAPTAGDDVVQLQANALDNAEIDPLANDADADGDHLTITEVTPASNGATAVSQNNLLYVSGLKPGITTLTYTVSDGRGGLASANVTIHKPIAAR